MTLTLTATKPLTMTPTVRSPLSATSSRPAGPEALPHWRDLAIVHFLLERIAELEAEVDELRHAPPLDRVA